MLCDFHVPKNLAKDSNAPTPIYVRPSPKIPSQLRMCPRRLTWRVVTVYVRISWQHVQGILLITGFCRQHVCRRVVIWVTFSSVRSEGARSLVAFLISFLMDLLRVRVRFFPRGWVKPNVKSMNLLHIRLKESTCDMVGFVKLWLHNS